MRIDPFRTSSRKLAEMRREALTALEIAKVNRDNSGFVEAMLHGAKIREQRDVLDAIFAAEQKIKAECSATPCVNGEG